MKGPKEVTFKNNSHKEFFYFFPIIVGLSFFYQVMTDGDVVDPLPILYRFILVLMLLGIIGWYGAKKSKATPLTLNNEGMFYESWLKGIGVSFIPLNEIEFAEISASLAYRSPPNIHLHLKVGEFSDSLSFPKTHKALVGDNIVTLNTHPFSESPEKICDEINDYIKEYGSASGIIKTKKSL